jgi:ATP-dependent protease ClpP protease subunit
MPNWNQILNEVTAAGSTYDVIRRRYLAKLHEKTGRNIIAYYSGWLQKKDVQGVEINDEDKNGLMTVIHQLDRSLGLDLLLHTPGGETAATESIVHYLRSMFGTNMRAIVPQLAMSGGTMIACACREILMGKPSSLGPIDPHFSGIPAHGVLEEFKRAVEEVKEDPGKIPIWQAIVAKYSPSFLGECQKAIDWSNEMTQEWLKTGMFLGESDASEKAAKAVKELSDHAITKSHSRHLHLERCKEEFGLKIIALEDDQDLQEKVLSVHHACMLTLSSTTACKLIENHNGVAFIKLVRNVILA